MTQVLLPILLVEDDNDRACVLVRTLERSGYRVVTATSGEAALAWLEGHDASLVVSDVVLPGMSGVELCERIKQRPASEQTPVLLMSGAHRRSEQQADGLEKGAEGYMGWPISMREFVLRVGVALRARRGEPAAVPASGRPVLSPRQREVVALIAGGCTTSEVATRLGISVRTAETHRKAIMRKLAVSRTSQLVAYAFRSGLLGS